VFQITFKQLIWNKIKQQLKNKNIQQLPVEYELENSQYQLAYKQAITLPSYSYLINKVNASSLVPELLNSDGQSTITTKVQKNQTVYSDGGDNRMVISNKTGKVTFSSYSNLNYYTGTKRSHVESLSYSDLLKQSFIRINSIGNSLDDVRFDRFDSTSETATFHSFVAGFPIINSNDYGGFRIQILNAGGQQYNFSIYSLQVMVPSSGRQLTLPATAQVYQSLIQAGYAPAKIKGIKIGYRWQTNHSSKLVADLIPSYFVNINGKWSSYSSLLENTDTSNTR
jgi:regulatory protein YycH of two-component signal transduction system YycFG